MTESQLNLIREDIKNAVKTAMTEHCACPVFPTEEDRVDIKHMVGIFRMSRNLMAKAFVGLAILGACVLAAIGAVKKLGHFVW